MIAVLRKTLSFWLRIAGIVGVILATCGALGFLIYAYTRPLEMIV